MTLMLVRYVSFVYFSFHYLIDGEIISTYFFYALAAVSGVGILLLILLYLNVRIIDPIINRLINSRWKRFSGLYRLFPL
ncbi:MAG: hypothetical protein U5L09_13775 [Bacteroidales bacterium]|nr:hypothetical protein [Bacteroidales bacterium]